MTTDHLAWFNNPSCDGHTRAVRENNRACHDFYEIIWTNNPDNDDDVDLGLNPWMCGNWPELRLVPLGIHPHNRPARTTFPR